MQVGTWRDFVGKKKGSKSVSSPLSGGRLLRQPSSAQPGPNAALASCLMLALACMLRGLCVNNNARRVAMHLHARVAHAVRVDFHLKRWVVLTRLLPPSRPRYGKIGRSCTLYSQ